MFEEFPDTPIALDFFWDSFPWYPYRARYICKFASGWLRVTRARFEFSFAVYERDLLVCMDDYQKVISPTLAESLFHMRTSYPYTPEEPEPIESLEAAQCDLLWDFIGGCDMESLDLLTMTEQDQEKRIAAMEVRTQSVSRELEDTVRDLHSQRRRMNLDDGEYLRLSDRIDALNHYLDLIPPALRREQTALRRERECLEAQIMASLKAMPEYETLYSIRWRIV